MIIKFLIEKEFKQLLRNLFLPRLILVFPCMTMLLMPWAMNLEIRNVSLAIVDNDCSTTSRRLVEKISASTYFRFTELARSYPEALQTMETGETDVILEIPRHFERKYVNNEAGNVLVAVNAVNGTKGGLGGNYLIHILNDFVSDLRLANPSLSEGSDVALSSVAIPTLRIETQNLFNPTLNYKRFMIPALTVMLLTLICGFLPTLNIVSEKEVGTIEQINVTPVSKFTFILSKLLPYWLIGLVVLTICFLLAGVLYDIVPVGHFGVIYCFVILFILALSGFGLVVSNYSSTMQQSMFVMWFCLLMLILLSGLFTPISSMPRWAQVITLFNPLKYLMEVMRMVFLRGSGFADLLPQLGALAAFAVFFNAWAVISYRKNN